VNLDNNSRLPIFRLEFFDVLGNKRAAENGWTYSGSIDIATGANKVYALTAASNN
jgi:hypothetical protein